MLFSAVSLLAIATVGSNQSVPQTNSIWKRIEPSVGIVSANGSVTGVAALIDDKGLFLVHASAVGGGSLEIAFHDETQVLVIVIATDDQTQLSLLKALVWSSGRRPVLKVCQDAFAPQSPMLAVTPTGPKTGEFIADGKAGMMRPSLRYVPLSEIRLESSESQIGGSIVFDPAGDIFGLLGATLVQQSSQRQIVGQAQGGVARLGSDSAINALESLAKPKYGPTGVTVAYALGREIVGRVVSGFRGADHLVHHPTIGLFFKNNPTGKGVTVESVMSGSPAASSGILPGDDIYEVDGRPTNTSVELAIALFKKNVGETVKIRYGRGTLRETVDVKVVSSQSTAGL